MKDILVFPFLSYITCSGGSRLPCCEDIQAVLWRGPRGQEPRPPANNQHEFARLATLEADPLALVKPSDDHSPS